MRGLTKVVFLFWIAIFIIFVNSVFAEKLLSISINPPDGNFVKALDSVSEIGALGQYASFKWSELESKPGKYQLKDFISSVEYLGEQRKFKLLIDLMVLNTNAKETPPDLINVSFDDPKMQDRFHKLIDAIAPYLKNKILYFSIGNEVDVYLTTHPKEWNAYQKFYENASQYVRSKFPEVKIGVCTTYDGIIGKEAKAIKSLNQTSDIWVITYYALGDNFHPNNPEIVNEALLKMVEVAEGKPVVIQELGYASSSILGSSEEQQRIFVANAFKTWDKLGDKVPFINFWPMYDMPNDQCKQLSQYYGLANSKEFQAYLCSVGLIRSDGSPKPAWSELLKARSSFVK